MSLFGRLFGAVREQYIARPPGMEQRLLYRHPNANIPRGARLTVRSDERAVFFRYGRLLSILEPGEHVLDTAGQPFLDALLVRPVTGGDHFIAELFFVREAEHLHTVVERSLGTFQEPQSNLVVNVQAQCRFGVRVTDPAALITTLAGQADTADDTVTEYLDARVTSMLSAVVGQIVGHAQVLSLVSNQHSEELGQRVKDLVASEFRASGLEFVRFLELRFRLDEASSRALQSFSSARAELALQREGAQVAQTPGFATFHLAQGQRAALQGLGQGLASGRSAPLIVGGPTLSLRGGYGGGYTPSPPAARVQPSGALPLAPSGPQDPAAAPWYVEGRHGPEGPFTLKQLKLRLRTIDAGARNTTRIRMGLGGWQTALDTPELADVLSRATPPPLPSSHRRQSRPSRRRSPTTSSHATNWTAWLACCSASCPTSRSTSSGRSCSSARVRRGPSTRIRGPTRSLTASTATKTCPMPRRVPACLKTGAKPGTSGAQAGTNGSPSRHARS